MKQVFIKKQNHSKLTLFFAGWGMDMTPFVHLNPIDSDLMVCYDYCSLEFDSSLLADYSEVRVIAWSMGVWVASQIIGTLSCSIIEKVAINGTLTPVDVQTGIDPVIFNGTVEGLNESSLHKFRRRMCKDREVFEFFLQHAPHRGVDELKEELIAIGDASKSLPMSNVVFDKAVIGTADMIFTPKCQEEAWKRVEVSYKLVDFPHYSNELIQVIVENRFF